MRKGRTLNAIAGVVGAGLVAVLTPVAAQAAVPQPACGSTLTRNTTLTRSLSCASGDGFVLAPGVTLNLGGHRLSGTSGGTGVTLADEGSSAVVNGRLDGWRTGISLSANSLHGSVRIDGVRLTGTPLSLSGTTKFTISNSRFVNTTVSLFDGLDASSQVLRSSVFDHSYLVLGETSVSLVDSQLRASEVAGSGAGQVIVKRSTFDGRGLTAGPWPGAGVAGISCYGYGVQISDSTISNYPVGVDATGCLQSVQRTSFRKNTVAVNQTTGFWNWPGESATTIAASDFVGNGTGLSLTAGARVTSNTFTRNGAAIVSQPGEYGQVISGNEVSRGTGTGISVGDQVDGDQPKEVLVRGNRVYRNGGQGIVVGAGAKDGSGNVAYGNAVSPQCVGVVCASS